MVVSWSDNELCESDALSRSAVRSEADSPSESLSDMQTRRLGLSNSRQTKGHTKRHRVCEKTGKCTCGRGSQSDREPKAKWANNAVHCSAPFPMGTETHSRHLRLQRLQRLQTARDSSSRSCVQQPNALPPQRPTRRFTTPHTGLQGLRSNTAWGNERPRYAPLNFANPQTSSTRAHVAR